MCGRNEKPFQGCSGHQLISPGHLGSGNIKCGSTSHTHAILLWGVRRASDIKFKVIIIIGEFFSHNFDIFWRNFSVFLTFLFFIPDKYVKFNEIDFFALEKYTNSDRTPPYTMSPIISILLWKI